MNHKTNFRVEHFARYHAEQLLIGAARGYKQSGKKLRPRDAYTASQLGPGIFSADVRRSDAEECRALGYPRQKRPTPKRIDKQARRAYESGARAATRAARRLVLAAHIADAVHHDDLMLRNCY